MDSLRVRLMLLAALALLPLAGLVFYNAEMQRRDAAAQAEDDAVRLARICADSEERSVDSAEQLLALMADIPAVKNLDAQACWALFSRVLGKEPGYANLGLMSARGELLTSAKPVAARVPLGQRTFFKEALERDRFVVSDFELEPGAGAEMMCGEPVLGENGELAGVIFAELDLAWMSDLKSRLGLSPGVTVAVLNHDGIILMRVPDPGEWVGTSAIEAPLGRAIVQGRGAGTAHGEGLDHVRRLYAFAPLDPVHGLRDFVSAGIPDDTAFSAARRSEHRHLLMLAVFALLAFAAAWFAADILVLRGLRMLLKATQKVTSGDLRTRAGRVPGGGEFRELATAFDTMAASIEKQSHERDAAEQELERRVEQRTAELEEANRKLRAFITNVEISERRMRLIIENAYDAYVAMDRDGVIVDWNPQAERVFGWSRAEAVGRPLGETIIPMRMREQHLKGLAHYLHTGEGPVLNRRIEMPALHRDGHEFAVEMTISTMRIEENVIFSAFVHDIHDRIRAKEKLEQAAAELRRSNEELEQFAYIASHDLQEPLRMVASYTQLIERRYAAQLDEPAREFIAFAVDGAKRMQQFITGLLRYSRVGTEPRVLEEVNLREAFEAAVANLGIAIEESGAKVEARRLPVVRGDPGQLAQLFQNLVGNALKFRKPDQPPRVEVSAEREGDFWRVSVRDNGIGLDPRFCERVFVIFQRLHTREEYEGTGLGLAICKKIVQRHGGRIWVESKEGEGATFSFTLPAAADQSHETVQG